MTEPHNPKRYYPPVVFMDAGTKQYAAQIAPSGEIYLHVHTITPISELRRIAALPEAQQYNKWSVSGMLTRQQLLSLCDDAERAVTG